MRHKVFGKKSIVFKSTPPVVHWGDCVWIDTRRLPKNKWVHIGWHETKIYIDGKEMKEKVKRGIKNSGGF